jgi:hypothetical protein
MNRDGCRMEIKETMSFAIMSYLKALKSKNKIIRNTSDQEPDEASKFEEFSV